MSNHILIIEDDRLVAKTLQRLLNQQGYKVVKTHSCKEALVAAERIEFDLIICDVRMPDIDGKETIQKIRDSLKQKNKRQIPEIFITGYFDKTSDETARRLNVADLLYKPFDRDRLLLAVKKALGEAVDVAV